MLIVVSQLMSSHAVCTAKLSPTRQQMVNSTSMTRQVMSHLATINITSGSRRSLRTSILSRMVANREMLDGGSRHEICQLGPPYGDRYDMTHLHDPSAVMQQLWRADTLWKAQRML